MRHLLRSSLFCALLAFLVLSSFGQGSITSGSFTFSYNNFGAPSNTNFSLGSTDQSFASWWWYRVGGDLQETHFPPPNTENYSGNVATFSWTNVNNRGFSAQLVTTLTPVNGNEATVSFTFTLNEITGNPLNINLFLYLDIDKGGSLGGDLATLTGPNTIRITDQSLPDFCVFTGTAANAYSAGVFGPELGLTDGSVTNFANTGLPFGPGDGTYGYQWTYNIAANGSQQTQASLFSHWPPPPAATGAISDGNALFRWNDFIPPTWGVDFNGVGTGDQTFAMGWYFRVAGDSREFPFPSPNRATYTGNIATFEWDDVDNRGLFSARLVTTVERGGPASGTVFSHFTATNLGSSPLAVSIFEYLDVDKGGSIGGDLAVSAGPQTIRIDDNVAPDFCYFKGQGAANFQVTLFNTLGTLLSDGSITNLNGSGLPFGPGDGVYGFQWNMGIAPNGSDSFISALAANEQVNLAIPTMGEWALILLSLLLLSFGTAYLLRQQTALAGAGMISASFVSLPFSRTRYLKTLAISFMAAAALALLLFTFDKLTLTDLGGAMICLPVLAYLLHLVLPAKE